MKVFVSQIYVEVGANFPFSHQFQRFLSETLTARVVASELFTRTYGEDFNLIFRMSAKAELREPEIKGPTVYRKDRDVEYTIFLTYNSEEPAGQERYRRAVRQLLDQVMVVYDQLQINRTLLEIDAKAIVDEVMRNPRMFTN